MTVTRAVSLVSTLLFSVLLAGCLRGEDGVPRTELAEFAFVDESDCPALAVSNCDELARNPAAAVRIANKTVTMKEQEEMGVFIQNIRRSMILDNLTIRGFPNGLYISLSGCIACTIQIKSLVIEELRAKPNWTATSFGIRLEGNEGGVSIRDSKIAVPGGGRVNREVLANGVTIEGSDGGYAAIEADGHSRIEVSRTKLSAAEPSALPGIWAGHGNGKPVSVLELHGVFIESFRRAVEFWDGDRLTINDVKTRCVESMLWVVDSDEIELENIAVSGCTSTAILLLDYERARIRSVTVANSTDGIIAWVNSPVRESELNISDSVFAGNHRAALETNLASGEIFNVTFQSNGVESDESGSRTPHGAILAGSSDLTIRQSSFVGNRAFGLVVVLGPNMPDARFNWWNDERGPRIGSAIDQQGMVPPLGEGSGDVVSDRVLFYPFLTSPPDA